MQVCADLRVVLHVPVQTILHALPDDGNGCITALMLTQWCAEQQRMSLMSCLGKCD
jgi:hypothetical protein